MITTTTTTTQVFQGDKAKGAPVVVGPVVTETPQGTPTITKTPVGDPEITKTPIGEPTFDLTGRCENTPGPQNPEAVENANPRALEPRPRGDQPTEDLPGDTKVDTPRGKTEDRLEKASPADRPKEEKK